MGFRAGLVLALAALSGCSLVSSTDLDDLDPGGSPRDAGPRPDGGRDGGGPRLADQCTSPGLLTPGTVSLHDTRLLRDDARATCRTTTTGSPDAIYRLSLPERGDVLVSTFGSDFDTVLAIRETCADESTEISCANDANSAGTTRIVHRTLAAGDYFVIAEGDRGASSGNLRIEVETTPFIQQRTCEDPLDISGGAAVFGRNNFRFDDLISSACGGEGGEEDVFRLRVDRAVRLRAHTRGSTIDTVLILKGPDCAEGVEIACDDDGGGGTASEIETELSPGTYHLIVDAHDRDRGEYRLVAFLEDL